MSNLKTLSKKEILTLSEIDRKNYFKQKMDELKKVQKEINRDIAIQEKQNKAEKLKKINHAKFLIAGELLQSKYAISFLQELAAENRFSKRNTEDLNLLMEDLNYNHTIKFIPQIEKKAEPIVQNNNQNNSLFNF